MNILIFLGVFLVFIGFYSLLAIKSSTHLHSSLNYFSVGKNLGLLPITFSLIATQLGGGMLLGTSENAYTIGIYGILYTLGMALGFLLLGLGFAARLQTLEVTTTAELFQTRYNSKILKVIASLCSILTLSGILISQIVGSKSVIQSLMIPSCGKEILFILFWLLIIIYTMLGGLKTVIITDIFQVIFIIIVFGGIFIYQLSHEPASFFSMNYLTSIQKSYFSTTFMNQFSFNILVATLIMPALFSLIEQDLAQRFFSAKSKKIAALSSLFASFFMITFSLIPIYLGIKARLFKIPIPAGTSPLIPVIAYLSNDLILALAICAIIAAITSTANALLCAISSNIVEDFALPFCVHKKVTQSQIVTLCLGILALLSSYLVPQNIINLLIGSYQISVNCLLIPLLVCLFSQKVKQQAAWFAIIGGAFTSLFTLCITTTLPVSLLPLLISAISYFIGTLIY